MPRPRSTQTARYAGSLRTWARVKHFRDRETIDVMPCKHCGSRNVTILWSPELQRYCLDCDASWDDNDLYETAARIWDELWEHFEKKHESSSDDTESDG